jgi:hypothetical protein
MSDKLADLPHNDFAQKGQGSEIMQRSAKDKSNDCFIESGSRI